MDLTIRKITSADDLTTSEKHDLIMIDSANKTWITKWRTMANRIAHSDTFLVFDGPIMAAYVMMKPNYPYFGGSLFIDTIKPDWRYNTDEILVDILYRILESYNLPDMMPVSVNVCKKRRSFERQMYYSMGFKNSLLVGEYGPDKMTLIAKMEKLKRPK